MAKHADLKSLFTAIADAIRRKTGKTSFIIADDFPSAIDGITTQDYTTEDALITDGLESYFNDRVTFISNFALAARHFASVSLPICKQIKDGAFDSCTNLENVNLPMVEDIGTQAFVDCYNLRFVDLPQVKAIRGRAFVGAPIETLILRRTDGTVSVADAFIPNSLVLYVPRVLLNEYKESDSWTFIATEIRAIEDYPEICG